MSYYFALLPRELREDLLYRLQYKTLLQLYSFPDFSTILNSDKFWENKAVQKGFSSELWTKNKMMYGEGTNPRYRYLHALNILDYGSGYRQNGIISFAVELDDTEAIKYYIGTSSHDMRAALSESIIKYNDKMFYKLFALYADKLDKDQLERLAIDALHRGNLDIINILRDYNRLKKKNR